VSLSQVSDLETALGQYIVYLNILEEVENDRLLYLAIRQATYQEIFSEAIGALVIRKNSLRLLVFDPTKEEIVQWIN
jgi:hypothetical protein